MNEQEKYDWMVYVSCMTFNHALYIEDAMNGFTMQETKFPFVCVIVDDASTDGEQGVIKNYLHEHFDLEDKRIARHEETGDYVLTFARHRTNLNCFFAVLCLKYNHYKKKSKAPYLAEWRDRAKYIALCEGDDYWTDSQKLQKQVDYLNRHSIYSGYATNALIIDKENRVMGVFSQKKSRDITSLDEMVVKRQFHWASIVLKSTIFNKQKYSWDTYTTCSMAAEGPIRYDDSVTCIYRKAGQGVTNTTPPIRWIEINENWSNILYEHFGPTKLSYVGAYLSLTRDILSLLILNKDLSTAEKIIIKGKYRKYTNVRITLKNIPFVLKIYLSLLIATIRNIKK